MNSIRLILIGIFLFTCLSPFAQINFTGSKLSIEEANKILAHHNKVRQMLGAGKLTWDPKIAAYAQAWAEYLANKNNCNLKHRNGPDDIANYGENIFWGSSADYYKPVDASLSWYDEKKNFRYSRVNEMNLEKTGHYTQMVWKTTSSMGAGMAACPSGGFIIVANYNPPGNYIGEYPY